MKLSYRKLTNADTQIIQTLLNQQPITNLYLRDLLDRQGVDYWGIHRWMGVFDEDELIALNVDIACMTPNAPCKLSVPVGQPEACIALGHYTATQGGVERIMAERNASLAFWQGLGSPNPLLNQAQWVMSIDARCVGETLDLRPATREYLPSLIESTALMRLEDEGVDPREKDPDLWNQTIEVLIAQRRIWIALEHKEPCFVIEIGTRAQKGTQIGSTYVPPKFRQRGLATKGMRTIVNLLLEETSTVSLLVHESNVPARKCYERVGFGYGDPYQLFAFC